MGSGRCSGWFYLWIIVLSRDLAADSTSLPHYSTEYAQVSFDQAVRNCSPGVLTSLATKDELSKVLNLVSVSVTPGNNFTFWVGLKKAKQCVDYNHRLRGFKWIGDNSEKSPEIRWTKEPLPTCTSVRCAALTGKLRGSTVTNWGLISISCKESYQFICKQTGQTSENKGTINKSSTTKPESTARGNKPIKPQPTKPATQKLEPLATEHKLPTQPQPDTDLKSTTGPELVRPQPGPSSVLMPGLESCQNPVIPGSRFLSLDPNNNSKIQVECWSTYQLELHCWGYPAVWRLPDNSPANFTTICQPCEAGLQKNAHGHCVDIKKCSRAPCTHTCLNMEDSYRCVCSDENGTLHEEDSEVCVESVTAENSSLLPVILIPVLVAVAVLVLLMVVVAVAVKCCLMRRSKKRVMKKAEKMAMRNKDSRESFATANEKTAT
ncbi:C-type lectin domain family 14 member A isoform X2 [Channa argus]